MARNRLNLVLPSTSNEGKDPKAIDSNTASIDLINRIASVSSELQNETIVIKVASNVIDNESLLDNFVDNVHLLSSCGANVIIVHDYVGIISKSLSAIGFQEKLINGLSVADFRMAQIIEMAVSGHINKKIVTSLCHKQCNAIGISGKDTNLIEAKKSEISQTGKVDEIVDLGFVGQPIMVNPEILVTFEEANVVTVIAPIACSKTKATYLLDVDMTASIIASSMGAKLLMLMSSEGLLAVHNKVVDKIDSVSIRKINQGDLSFNIQNMLHAGITAIDNNVENAHIIDSKDRQALLYAIFLHTHSNHLSNIV